MRTARQLAAAANFFHWRRGSTPPHSYADASLRLNRSLRSGMAQALLFLSGVRMKKLLFALLLAISIGTALIAQPQPRLGPDVYSRLRWRYIGPEGNRIAAVVGVPGDPLVYYAGSASGGVSKTTDGGVHWEPIFDDQPVQSIGSLAVAPSD